MNTSLGTRKIGDWVIRERIPVGDGPHPILLLLHGWTGNENSMWLFTSRLSHNFMILSPRGIFPTPLGGFGWHIHGRRSWPSVVDFKPAVEGLLALISTQNFTSADLSEIHMIGFSQGAALMYAIALEFPTKVGALRVFPDSYRRVQRN
jgi:phospholipase/carboxylesterase